MTPYQSEDPSQTVPTSRKKDEKEKTVEDKMERAASANKEALALLLKPVKGHTIDYSHQGHSTEILRGE